MLRSTKNKCKNSNNFYRDLKHQALRDFLWEQVRVLEILLI